MKQRIGGHPTRAFEMRDGATKPFYVTCKDWLTTGDTLSTAVWTVPSPITESSSAVNSAELTLGGVTHPANTVAQITLTGADVGRLYECEVLLTTANGVIDVRTIWEKGVRR